MVGNGVGVTKGEGCELILKELNATRDEDKEMQKGYERKIGIN